LSRRRPTTRTLHPFYFAREEHCKTWTAHRRNPDTTTTTTTGIHTTDQLLVSTTPYYAHLSPLLLRARGALQDLDRISQETGHHDDYHDRGALNYAYLVWLGCLVPGLYEVIPYTLSLLLMFVALQYVTVVSKGIFS